MSGADTARRVKTARLTVNLRIKGIGPPLLYLGGSSFDLSIKAPVFESALPEKFTVAAGDPRGLGRTDAPNGIWTMLDYARDAIAIMDTLGWSKANVLGESFGAMSAMVMACLAPERINRLWLAAGASGGVGGSSYPIENLASIGDAYQRAKLALQILDRRFVDVLEHSPSEASVRIEQRVKTESRFLASHANAVNHPRLLAARANHNCWESLLRITAPTLVIAGLYDNQAPLDRAINITRMIPNAELAMFKSGHDVCFSTTKPVERIIGSCLCP